MQFVPQPRWKDLEYYSIGKLDGGRRDTSQGHPVREHLVHELALVKYSSFSAAHWCLLIRAQGEWRGEIHHAVDGERPLQMRYEFAYGARPEDSTTYDKQEILGTFPGAYLWHVRQILEGVPAPSPRDSERRNCQDWVTEALEAILAYPYHLVDGLTEQETRRVRGEIEPKPPTSQLPARFAAYYQQ